jgi:hypothetical protein
VTTYLIFRAVEAEEAAGGYWWECITIQEGHKSEDAIEVVASLERWNPDNQYEHWGAVPITNFTWIMSSEHKVLRFERLEISPAPDTRQTELDVETETETEPEPEPPKPETAKKSGRKTRSS